MWAAGQRSSQFELYTLKFEMPGWLWNDYSRSSMAPQWPADVWCGKCCTRRQRWHIASHCRCYGQPDTSGSRRVPGGPLQGATAYIILPEFAKKSIREGVEISSFSNVKARKITHTGVSCKTRQEYNCCLLHCQQTLVLCCLQKCKV